MVVGQALTPSIFTQTALSSNYNLYLAGSGSQVHVYQPSFPEQKLNKYPDLVLTPPSTGKRLQGDISALQPHDINHIHVAYVGDEEWLLLARDDGDIVCYHTRAIHNWIENYTSCDCKTNTPWEPHTRRCQPRHIALWHVGRSAWGLAVHTRARLVGVSSNLRRAEVIALALRSVSEEEEERRKR